MKILKHLEEKDFSLRMMVVIFAAISPFILIFSHGVERSLSAYWNTDLQPIFIITNFTTAYYFFTLKNWWLSALLLILLTAFSVSLYGDLHDILAVMFFLSNLYPLYKTNHYRWIIIGYLTALPILPLFGMLWAEIVAIEFLCLYQLLILRKLYILDR